MHPAILNLAVLRQLIAESRAERPAEDAEKLRMLRAVVGTGTVKES